MHNVWNNPHFQTLSTLNREFFFYLYRFLEISVPTAAILCAVPQSLQCKPCKEQVKAWLSTLLKRLKCYRWKLLVRCSAFPHAINNSSCFQTKLQSNAVIVPFIAGCGKLVVNYTSAEKRRLLKEQNAWWPTSASSQLVLGMKALNFQVFCSHKPFPEVSVSCR